MKTHHGCGKIVAEVIILFINYDSDITVTDVFFVVRLLNSPVGTTFHRQNRNRWAITLKAGGKTIYTAEGREIVSDSLHPIIMPRGSDYSWRCVESGECIILEFDGLETYSGLLSFELADNSRMLKLLSRAESLLNSPGGPSPKEARAIVYELLLLLERSTDKKYVPSDRKTLLLPATEYISTMYYRTHITNDSLAKLCGMSTVYFRKLFADVYGISPIKHLNSFRIEKAKAMLLTDYESIGQIAGSVGYRSIYHFSKMFKAHTGVSPKEYKNAHLR